MLIISVKKLIEAEVGEVFDAVADVAGTPEWVPDVERIEFLGEQRSGVGTRFRETRLSRGKPMETDLEITELEETRVRMVTDSHGTVWDTLFDVWPVGEAAELSMQMAARPHKLMSRILNPLMSGMFRRGMESHLEVVAARCEHR
jgi:ribosome-associated toxin RatA of RatAB toxin-antitoxin module